MRLIVPELDPEPWARDSWLTGPTPHVAWRELACKDGPSGAPGTPYPTEWRNDRAVPLCGEFEVIRATFGGPIQIGSAFRTLTHNRSAGSFDTSQHPHGLALDLWTPRGLGVLDFLDIVIAASRRPAGIIRGIGVYPWGIHIDIRKSNRIARWKGTRVAPEVWKRLADGV